ncbi:MAG TPA: hypothetical protein DCL61_17640 [Cyanobacteria bacterium UBA12227]|nr:hypothetical protein [Cyanobacteria bacterium UBA12227]HAX86087.1 hypothetical protein [Cyanobacteria bacterium UBA11370]HBY76523.1 hypothetical protein [Cyanobacteria bacterium UBA11148]
MKLRFIWKIGEWGKEFFTFFHVPLTKIGNLGLCIPHSADVAGIFLSVVKAWSHNAFSLKLCGFSVTGS